MQKGDFSLIKKKIKRASNVYIMGHKDIDLDSFASAIGIYSFSLNLKKDSFIIIDDIKYESGVKKIINKFKDNITIIKSESLNDYYDEDSILVIVDTNKYHLLSNPEITNKFRNILVIDHHSLSGDSFNGDNFCIINDTSSSSTCEMFVKFLIKYDYSVSPEIATALLSGIVLDTNNFIINIDSDTYYSAYYLCKCGAVPRDVQVFMKQDVNEYIEMQKVITDVKIINNKAVCKGLQNKIYKREDLAKIADTILLFNNVEASFVVGKVSKGVGISARSMGKVDVGAFLERFNGGGDNHEAATFLLDAKLNDVNQMLLKNIKKI